MKMLFFLGVLLIVGGGTTSVQAFELRTFDAPTTPNSWSSGLHYDIWFPGVPRGGSTDYNSLFIDVSLDWMATYSPITITTEIKDTPPCERNFDGNLDWTNWTAGWVPGQADGDGSFSIIGCQGELLDTTAYAFFQEDIILNDYSMIFIDPNVHEWLPDWFSDTVSRFIGWHLGLNTTSSIPSSVMHHAYNGGNITIDDICGISMILGSPYHDCPIILTQPRTLSGASTNAKFVGGASADGGLSYRSSFRPSEWIQVFGTVVTDENHVGIPGKLHVVVENNGRLFGMSSDGGWMPLTDNPFPLPTAEWHDEQLGFANDLKIFEGDFYSLAGTPQDSFIGHQSANIFLLYSVLDIPGEYFFAAEPIRIEWRDE